MRSMAWSTDFAESAETPGCRSSTARIACRIWFRTASASAVPSVGRRPTKPGSAAGTGKVGGMSGRVMSTSMIRRKISASTRSISCSRSDASRSWRVNA